MKFGSLFAGIGGIDLGLERAGMECAWQVEIDPFCRKVLAKHWPDVPKFEDVREVGAHNLPPVDVVAGGFPCQDISLAGKGAGLEGERSGLWWEYHRIIRELRPRYVIVENVRALTVRGLDAVLGSLADIGFDAEWQMLSAESVGAPHRRDRIFIVAYRDSITGEIGGVDQADASEGHCGRDHAARSGTDDRREPGACEDAAYCHSDSNGEPTLPVDAETPGMPGDVAVAGCELLERREQKGATDRPELRRNAGWWATEPDVGRVAHGVPYRVDRLRGLGNAVVPQVVEFVGRMIMEADNGRA